MKKLFLLAFVMIAAMPFASASHLNSFWGHLLVDGTLQNDTSIPVEFYLGDQLKYTTHIGDNITNASLQDNYFIAQVVQEDNETETNVTARVWGLIGYSGTFLNNITLNGINITVNITRLANGGTCSYNQACTSGVCCAGTCAATCTTSINPTSTGGGGGGGGGSTPTTLVPTTIPPPTVSYNPPATTSTETSTESTGTASQGTGVQTGYVDDTQDVGNQITGAVVGGAATGTKWVLTTLGILLAATGGFFLYKRFK